jgi:hypothetical protein
VLGDDIFGTMPDRIRACFFFDSVGESTMLAA